MKLSITLKSIIRSIAFLESSTLVIGDQFLEPTHISFMNVLRPTLPKQISLCFVP